MRDKIALFIGGRLDGQTLRDPKIPYFKCPADDPFSLLDRDQLYRRERFILESTEYTLYVLDSLKNEQTLDSIKKHRRKMKTEEKLKKQLERIDLEILNLVDKVEQIKIQMTEVNKEPSIYELMPIGSVWCGHEVIEHDQDSKSNQIGLLSRFGGWSSWPKLESLHELMEEQRKLDATRKAADAALKYSKNNCNFVHLIFACDDYKTIVEQEIK